MSGFVLNMFFSNFIIFILNYLGTIGNQCFGYLHPAFKITIHLICMKNAIEQQDHQYENVAEFLKNIFLIDVCVQHSRTINYSTVRSLPWKLGWILWEILFHWICPAGISFIKHDLLQYAVKSICQHENMKSNAGSSRLKVFFGGKSICWKFQVLAALPADHNKADSSGHQTFVLFVLMAKCW